MAVAAFPEPYRRAPAPPWTGALARTSRAAADVLRRRGRRRALGLMLVGPALFCLALAAFNDVRLGMGTAAPAVDAPAPAPAPRWIDIEGPSPAFLLASPEFGTEPSRYEARREAQGDGRRDILDFGRFDGTTPYLRLSLDRLGSEAVPPASFFVELARRAGDAALALTRSDLPGSLATRFGDFEVADVALARGPVQGACLAFRLNVENPGFRVAGFACGDSGKPLTRAVLACALDRLDLAPVAADRDLSAFFAAARQKPERGCGDQLAPAHTATRNARKIVRVPKSTNHPKTALR